MDQLTRLIEAALFASSRPLTVKELRSLDSSASESAVRVALQQLTDELEQRHHGVGVVEIAGGYQILTRSELVDALERAKISQRPRRLSRAALETLAVIAYRQPVGRAEVEDIRGVAVDGVVRLLLDRGLIDVAGYGEGMGKPLLYGTTPLFLEYVGLNSVDQLPRVEDFSVLLRRVGVEVEEGESGAGGEPESSEEAETKASP